MFKFDEEQKVGEQSANEDWDVISNLDLKPISPNAKSKQLKSMDAAMDASGRSLIALWSNTAADKAVSVFQKVIHGFTKSNSRSSKKLRITNKTSNVTIENAQLNSQTKPLDLYEIEKLKPPIGDSEYRNFIDSDGRIIILSDLKQRIFEGGCEPSRRKELWPILLNIFPSGGQQVLTSVQRNEFIKKKSVEYINLKSTLWFNMNKNLLKKKQNSQLPENELTILANKIQKDVWRTDRCHRFYSGESNRNVETLFNILLTYSLANGGFYAQGMSDLLSPLFYVLRDEALAFVCFTSVMKRCATNFNINSDSICTKIELLTCLICKYDPVFWDYLREQSAEQLLFVYRWLLIDCKREFPFQESLRMFEIMWSTIETSTESVSQFESGDGFFTNFYSRSNSNASSINLRLFKSYLNTPNAISYHTLSGDGASASSNCVDDELISDDQNGSIVSNEKSFTPNSKQTANHMNSSGNNFLCEFCSTGKLKKMGHSVSQTTSSDLSSSGEYSSESSLDEDCIETLAKKRNRTKWKQNNRFHPSRRCNEIKQKRTRYLSLNVNHEATSVQLKTKLNELKKDKCLNDIINKPIKSLVRSLSASCIECVAVEYSMKKKSTSVSFKNVSKLRKSTITIAKRRGILIQPAMSSPAKFSTSESGTLKYSQNNILLSTNLSSLPLKESVSDVEESGPIKPDTLFLKSKNYENLNNRSEIRCKCSINSYNDSHDDESFRNNRIQVSGINCNGLTIEV